MTMVVNETVNKILFLRRFPKINQDLNKPHNFDVIPAFQFTFHEYKRNIKLFPLPLLRPAAAIAGGFQ